MSYPQDGSPYGYPPRPYAREHPDGTTVLVLGILSLALCSVFGPFAWSRGNRTLAEIDLNPMAYTNRGTVQAGKICGIVATCFLVLSVGTGVLAVLVSAATSAST